MITLTEKFNQTQLKDTPGIKPGDTIKVHQKITEGGKERIQIFEGVVIAKKHGKGVSATMTVRKVVEGIGVERIFPIHSPMIGKVEVVKSGKVRRAKLYYLREVKGKKAKLKKKYFSAAIAPTEQSTLETPQTTENATSQEPASEARKN